jgi:hypothetical protein
MSVGVSAGVLVRPRARFGHLAMLFGERSDPGRSRRRVVGRMVASVMTFPEHGIVVSVTSNISYADTLGVGVKIAQVFAEQRTPARK